jgi:hypothetical protein
MAAPDGVVCAVAVNNEAAENAHLPPQPRHQRASVRGATRSDSGSRRAEVTGGFIAGEKVAHAPIWREHWARFRLESRFPLPGKTTA